tara:strand:- start:163 stop:339 length:177 start_codon:yes stop_codon:yes gene_type:complete
MKQVYNTSNTAEQIANELRADLENFLDLFLSQSLSLEKLDEIARDLQNQWNLKKDEEA